MRKMLDKEIKNEILIAQGNEITEHLVYKKLSESIKNKHNKKILKHISNDEFKHYNFLKKFTNKEVGPDKLRIWTYFFISRVFGITFGIKLMESKEKQAHAVYNKLSKFVPVARIIAKEEDEHERQLIGMIDEERLKYISSMVLGLNDALVEFTAMFAGLTFALQNTRLIAIAGLITGIAASLSMAASSYLSTKSEEGTNKNPLKASFYTGFAYALTVLFLTFPYLLFTNPYFSLGFTILNALVVIFIFTFYISIAKDTPFRKRFFEMALISIGIAALTFGVGFLIRMFFNIV